MLGESGPQVILPLSETEQQGRQTGPTASFGASRVIITENSKGKQTKEDFNEDLKHP